MSDLRKALPKTWSTPTMSPYASDTEKYGILDMDWIYEWWPVPVLLLGLYFIFHTIRSRSKGRDEPVDTDY